MLIFHIAERSRTSEIPLPSAAAYAVIGKTLTGAMGPRRITALINLWGLALVTPFGLWQALSFDLTTVMLPVSAALVGVLALGETLVAAQAVALAVSLVGVLLATAPGTAMKKNDISQ